jgi:DNA-binding HxlR family transcriptional regulator
MDKNCTVYRTADLVGRRWTLLILLELNKGLKWKRYSHLKSSLLDITPKILSMRLKELEARDLLVKKITADKFPIKCEYSLTPKGKDFFNVIKNIKEWSLKWEVDSKVCKKTDCETCGS